MLHKISVLAFIILLFTLVSCNKDDSNSSTPAQTNTTSGISIDSKLQLNGIIDSTNIQIVDGENSSKVTTNFIIGIPPFSNIYKYNYFITFEDKNGIVVTLKKGTIDVMKNDIPTESQFNYLFRKGKYTFDKDDLVVEYSDGRGNSMGKFLWSTATGQQTNSSFEIIDYKYTGDPNVASCRIVAKLSCTLYNRFAEQMEVEFKDVTVVWEIKHTL